MEMLISKAPKKPYRLALISSFLFLVITIIIFTEAYNRLRERNATLFDLRVETAERAIEKRMIDYIQILKGTQGLISMSDTVTRREFEAYVENLDVEANYPGVQGIGYALFVHENSKREFEEDIINSGFSNFKIWPFGRRNIYSSIIYLEPFDKLNIKAFGYDMYSDSVRKEAMARARDSGEASLSGAVVLVQEGQLANQKGFNLYLPIYENGSKPESIKARKSKIKGFVYSPFRINDLMNGILQSNFEDLNIQLFDGGIDSEENLLYTKIDKANSQIGLKKTVQMQQGGRTWSIIFSAASGFGHNRNFPYFLLGGGLIISVLIFIILVSYGYIQQSTHLKQVITDNATAGLLIINKRGVCTFMNPSAERLTGYEFSEMANKHILELFHDRGATGDQKVQNNELLHSLFEGELKDFESILLTKSEKKFFVSINSKVIREGSNKESVLFEIRNISKEKKAESELKKRNKSLQTLNKIGTTLSAELELKKILQIITDACTDLTKAEFGAFIYNRREDEDGSMPLVNFSGARANDFSNFPDKAEFIGNSPSFHREEIVRIEDLSKHPEYAGGLNPAILNTDLKLSSYLIVPVVSRDSSVIGSLVFGHGKPGRFNKKSEDIVVGIAAQAAIAIDNSQLFESLSKKNTELIKINNDLDNFVYTASHDLKAPVLNIEGLVYALTKALEENRTEKVSQMMEMIKKSILKFKETIQGLTEVARTNKNVDDDLEYVDIEELLDDIKQSIKDILSTTKTEIHADIQCRKIFLSKNNLRSVIFNLITNAIKYSSPHRTPHILFTCVSEGDNDFIEVQDNGLGIPKEHHQKIFLMFKRLHTHAEGTGIGLYLVKRIVENEGGSICVESELNKGTKFTIKLPHKFPRRAT